MFLAPRPSPAAPVATSENRPVSSTVFPSSSGVAGRGSIVDAFRALQVLGLGAFGTEDGWI